MRSSVKWVGWQVRQDTRREWTNAVFVGSRRSATTKTQTWSASGNVREDLTMEVMGDVGWRERDGVGEGGKLRREGRYYCTRTPVTGTAFPLTTSIQAATPGMAIWNSDYPVL